MTACRRFVVSGRVQGVAFRAATLDEARRLRVTGWVRNLSSGDVEVLGCGSPVALSALERWLWQGPSAARVTGVEASDVEYQTFDTFVIRHDASR